jgi:hypothetical protein
MVEDRVEDQVKPKSCESLQFGRRRGESGWGAFGLEELPRMRLGGHDAEWQARRRGAVSRRCQQGLVAQVEAVEVAKQ